MKTLIQAPGEANEMRSKSSAAAILQFFLQTIAGWTSHSRLETGHNHLE